MCEGLRELFSLPDGYQVIPVTGRHRVLGRRRVRPHRHQVAYLTYGEFSSVRLRSGREPVRLEPIVIIGRRRQRAPRSPTRRLM